MMECILITMNKYIIGMMIGVVSSGLAVIAPVAQAQLIVRPQEPLVYEYNLAGPLVTESAIISTGGIIKTISIFAVTQGEVRLEVSANAGIAYTRIANGQILSDGFMPGNQLRFRASISEGGALEKVILGFSDSSGASKASFNLNIVNFKNQKAVRISGASEELFNYPLKINIGNEIFAQGVYFTAADGQSPLDYYIEDSGYAWVKIPEIPKEGISIYLYYDIEDGRRKTEDQGDGKKVFPFFDDFNSTVLDEGKWQVKQELKGEFGLKDGYLKLAGCSVVSRDFKMKKGILEFKARAQKDSAIQAIVHGANAPHSIYALEEIVYSSAYPGAEHTIGINNVAKLNVGKAIAPLTDYIYKAVLNDSGITFERYSAGYTKEAEIRYLDNYKNEAGYIGLKADSALAGAGSVYFDWVRVRPYVEVEPVAEVAR